MKHCLLAIALLAAACAKNDPPSAPQATVLAKVNGKSITNDQFEAYAQIVARRPAKDLTPEQQTQVLDDLISMQLSADTAERSGLTKQTDVASQLEVSRMTLLSQAAFKKYLDEHPIGDAELKAEYDLQTGSAREYRARHILVESRALADDLIAQLNKGADFRKLAEKNSVDGSAKQGGDLGWFNLRTMVPQFSGAVAALEKGKYTATPVQTQYGWHVIKLEDTRAASPPAFDTVKDEVRNLVQRKKIQAYVQDLRKTAKIDKLATPTPKKDTDSAAPAAPTPAPTK